MADDNVVSKKAADDLIPDSASKREREVAPKRALSAFTQKLHSDRLNELRIEDHRLDSRLKKVLGYGILSLLTAQLAVMDIGFLWYGYVQVIDRGGELSDAVVIAWITTTIAQVIGLATVVAKYLFPGSGSNWTHEPGDE